MYHSKWQYYAYHFFSTWMTSWMHIEKRRGKKTKKGELVIPDWYFGEGMETNSVGEKVKNSPKWLTPIFFNMHLWRHPGRAKMLCMLSKMIHKYTTMTLESREKQVSMCNWYFLVSLDLPGKAGHLNVKLQLLALIMRQSHFQSQIEFAHSWLCLCVQITFFINKTKLSLCSKLMRILRKYTWTA